MFENTIVNIFILGGLSFILLLITVYTAEKVRVRPENKWKSRIDFYQDQED